MKLDRLGQNEHIHKKVIEACKKGDNRARYELYGLYSKAMFNICYRMMNNREEAEDMLQEAFTQAFMKLDSYRYESGFGSWLKRIVINTCINAINKRKVDLTYCEEIYHYDKYDENDDYEPEYTVANVAKAMEQLPEGGRMVFSLYLLEGYDHTEIAQIMNITESTSKTQFMRAKRRIAELLKQTHGDAVDKL
ncbi:MAG TPA: sigma-70 family RNA polymerase sigma factor [Draconibacterium sp.]|nr:sigma-70 family RNA polymerase sigma factor [Draconibacterium sp.]